MLSRPISSSLLQLKLSQYDSFTLDPARTECTLLLAYSSGAGMMIMLALPFFVVYVVSKKSWWALIPAGAFTSIAVIIVLPFLVPDEHNTQFGLYSGVLFLGLAITFGILWLRRKSQPTDWASYPAARPVGFVHPGLFILGDGWNTLSDQTKAIAFAVASAVFFVCYLVNGFRKWGWLFPTLVCAAMALTSWMIANNMRNSPG